MGYYFSLNRNKLILLIISFIFLSVLIFLAGLLSGIMTVTYKTSYNTVSIKSNKRPVSGPVRQMLPSIPGKKIFKIPSHKKSEVIKQAVLSKEKKPEPAIQKQTRPNKFIRPPKFLFSVQVGAFLSKKRAIELYNLLFSRGYDPYIFFAEDEKGKKWHTVRIGNFEVFDQASKAVSNFMGNEKREAVITYIDSLKPATPEHIKKTPVKEKQEFGLYPYSIRLACFRSIKSIKVFVSKCKKKGIHPYTVTVNLDEKGIWHQIFSGYFKTEKEAKKTIKDLNLADAMVIKTPWTNLISIYTQGNNIEGKSRKLKSLGFDPYVITAGNNLLKLFVGAFRKKGAAMEQNLLLKRVGISAQVVER